MGLTAGTRLGPYEIEAPLGAGGMGEVYRARDTRLDRTVAIKVLAAQRIADPQMRQRFDREARAVAALSHPHICHLNDVGHHDGVDYLVMEYLDGETLAARLARAAASRTPALPLDEVLRHAIQIAEALAEAHRHGIVHRDLKPGNVILIKTGVKLLDFGLAKLQSSAGAVGSLSTQGATREAPLTGEGSIMGTWPYMAPEQLEGRDTDARTDIFAFGALLYEMASGVRAFEGDSHASLIAAILERDPIPLADRQRAVPAALDRVVRKCLAKQPDARWQSARDLADELKWIAEDRGRTEEAVAVATPPPPTVFRRVWPWAAAVVAALGIGAAVARNIPRDVAAPAAVRRFAIQPPANTPVAQPSFALSPDGRTLVFSARSEQGPSLYLRPMDQQEAQPLAGTTGGCCPVFSPDGAWVAFIQNGTLKKISLKTGASPVTLADLPDWLGQFVWLPDNSIVVAQIDRGLSRVAAEGGTPVRLTTPATDQGEIDHHNPQPLPGGKALLITRHRGPEAWDVAVLDLATKSIRVIVPDALDARYLRTGHLVFARGDALLAAPFEVDRLEVSGAPVVIADHVLVGLNDGVARYRVAEDGTLAYVPAPVTTGRRLVWVGGSGPPEPLPIRPGAFSRPSLSPNGLRLAVQVDEGARSDLWIYDFAAGTMVPFTQDGASESPIWTPDGQHLTFSTNKTGRREIFWQRVDGTSLPELLVSDRFSVHPGSWSTDGRRLTFIRQPPTDATEIGVFDLDRRSATTLIGEGEPNHPRESPDGRWLAYSPLQRGGRRVAVVAADGRGAPRIISSDNAAGPVWSRDGQRLYYRTLSDFIFVDMSAFPAVLGKPTIVGTVPAAIRGGFGGPGYDVAPDGRVLAVQPAAEEMASLRFEIVLNWFQELEQRVPVRR